MSSPTGSSQWFANPGANFYNGVAKTSVRFNPADDAYLTREFDAPSNNKKWTYSTWLKRSKLAAHQAIISSNVDGSNYFDFRFSNADILYVQNRVGGSNLIAHGTTSVFRDTSAWYNIVLIYDSDNSTAANRTLVYVNGVKHTLASVAGDGDASYFNLDGINHNFGASRTADSSGTVWSEFGGYVSEVNFCDGQAYAPTNFGETKNGVWIPINTSGLTFGNNGFRIRHDQVGVGTASTSTIGADVSGNTNHLTSVNIVASDCAMPDSPENNFSTLNALDNDGNTRTGLGLTEGNLEGSSTVNGWDNVRSTFTMPTGKWYVELLSTSGIGNGNSHLAIMPSEDAMDFGVGLGLNFLGYTSTVWAYSSNGGWYNNYVGTTAAGQAGSNSTKWAADAIVALTFDGSTLKFYKNNSLIHTVGSIPSADYAIAIGFYDTDESGIINFGQDSSFAGNETAQGNTDENGIGDFYYEPPSGFLALCTANLSEPTIGPNSDTQATDHFNTVIYTGDASTNRNITGYGFQVDWIWVKERNSTSDHRLHDSSRGAGKVVRSSSSDGQLVRDEIDSFISDGFHISGASDGIGAVNQSTSQTYVAWGWKANGGTTTTNDASSTSVGTIDSVFQANTTAGFSIVTFAADNTAGRVVAHGLGVAPKMIITKGIAQATGWYTYHFNIGANKFIRLNEANPEATNTGIWGNTHPTSSVFTIGNNECGYNNGGANDVLAYCFAEVDGYSKMGSYVGNVDAEGVYVYLGFRPAWILLKRTTGGSTYNWFIHDNKRGAFNVNDERLTSDTNEAESTSITSMDFLSSGFKIRTANTSYNEGNFIYMAFAAQPFKYANGG